MTQSRSLHFGFMLPGNGYNRSSWRHPDAAPGAATDLRQFIRTAELAERGLFDFLFLADHPFSSLQSPPHLLNRLEPVTILSALAAVTSHIGLVGTVSASFTEPFNVARYFGSLDRISGGRAGWNVVTTGYEDAALNYNRDRHLDHEERYRRAAEHLDVVRGLWDSFEPDAIVEDRDSGVYADLTKLHPLNHEGEFFSVRGPLNVAPSEQGQPVIFQAGASGTGRDLAARSADAIFVGAPSIEEVREFYGDIKRRAVAFGRSRDDILVLPGITPIVGRTDAEAEEKHRALVDAIDPHEALADLAIVYSGVDLTTYPLDEPFPDLGEIGRNGYRSATDRYKRLATENGWTLRETALWYVAPSKLFVGSAETVADRLARWFGNDVSDGFIIRSAEPSGLADFVDHVVPVLQERGLYRTDYGSATLRGNLGLRVPTNRYVAAREKAASGAAVA